MDNNEISSSKLKYNALLQRYKEIVDSPDSDPEDDTPPYDIKIYLTQTKLEPIDIRYMNFRFEKYIQVFKHQNGESTEELEKLEIDLHKAFSCLSQEDQKFADILLRDIQRGFVTIQEGKTFRDYITDYATRAQDDKVHQVAVKLGLDESKLRCLKNSNVNLADINQYGRFDALKNTVDKDKAKEFFEGLEKTNLPMSKVNQKVDKVLTDFIIKDVFID